MDVSPGFLLIIIIILLFLSSFFSSAETALTTVNKLKLRSRADEGSKRAKKVLKVTEQPGKLLSAILIGNNIVNISASALTTTLCTDVFGSKYIGYSTGILTFLVLIFGEITPKTLATKYSLKLSMIFVYPISWLMFILTPVIWLLNLITGLIYKILHVDIDADNSQMTESELRTVVNVSHEDGVIEPEEKFMISNVVDFGDALCKDIMIPRADIVCADANSSYDELIKLFMSESYSRIPIYEESKDNIIGILYLKDLFYYSQVNDTEYFDLRSILRKPVYVYEHQKTSQLFADLKTSAVTMAIVIDEYAVASGIITMEDLIEEIVGEIRDEYDEDEKNLIKEISENEYDIDASIKLTDLNDAIGTSLTSDNYDSLGGFVIEIMDKLPQKDDEADYENIHFKVINVIKNRIDRILVTIISDEAGEDDTDEASQE
ncbi:MAG: HlyC/CorC family transporter [Lachnospiraceae bacterium]|nr:HlyC/CorC family transporter [Lachnospiraceae bacterium]MBR1817133.1 HlyC/CorC family transporter [Lachnospiraceae bacterium]